MSEEKKLTVKASDQNLAAVNDFIHSMLPAGCDEMLLNQIDLAVEEIFVNIAHYAYAPKTGDAEITCVVEKNEKGQSVLTIIFKDRGVPFNPLARPDPDPATPLEERGIGGWGIFLTKKYMDSVTYAYEDGKNMLTLTKTIG